MSEYTDILDSILNSNNIGDDLSRFKQLFGILDERTPPKPENGWHKIEAWDSVAFGGSLNWAGQSANGGLNSQGNSVMALRTGTAANGVTAIHLIPTLCDLSRGGYDLVFAIDPDAPETGQEQIVYAGFGDSAAATSKTGHTDGIAFAYDPASTTSATNWVIATVVAGTFTELLDTGIAFAAGKRFFRIKTAKDGSSISFYSKLPSDAEWTTLHVEATDLPTASFGPHFAIEKTAGTTQKILDLYSVSIRHEYLNA